MTDPMPRRRWIVWALVVSLGVNLAISGLVLGVILRGPPNRPPPPGDWVIARDLPEPYREDMIRQLRDGQDQWIAERRVLAQQRYALAEALEANPFDFANVETVIRNGQEVLAGLASRSSDLLLQQIDEMSAEDRAEYAHALREAPKGPRHGGPEAHHGGEGKARP